MTKPNPLRELDKRERHLLRGAKSAAEYTYGAGGRVKQTFPAAKPTLPKLKFLQEDDRS